MKTTVIDSVTTLCSKFDGVVTRQLVASNSNVKIMNHVKTLTKEVQSIKSMLLKHGLTVESPTESSSSEEDETFSLTGSLSNVLDNIRTADEILRDMKLPVTLPVKTFAEFKLLVGEFVRVPSKATSLITYLVAKAPRDTDVTATTTAVIKLVLDKLIATEMSFRGGNQPSKTAKQKQQKATIGENSQAKLTETPGSKKRKLSPGDDSNSERASDVGEEASEISEDLCASSSSSTATTSVVFDTRKSFNKEDTNSVITTAFSVAVKTITGDQTRSFNRTDNEAFRGRLVAFLQRSEIGPKGSAKREARRLEELKKKSPGQGNSSSATSDVVSPTGAVFEPSESLIVTDEFGERVPVIMLGSDMQHLQDKIIGRK
jgi:hypothetical protein